MRAINLLPETLQEKQKKAKVHTLVNAASIILLIFASTILAALFFYRVHLTNQGNMLHEEESQLELSLTNLREEEGLYRYIGLKLSGLSGNLKKRQVYGGEIAKLKEVFSNTVVVTKMSIDQNGKILVSGEAASYPDLAIKLADLAKEKILQEFEIAGLSVDQKKGVVNFDLQGKLANGF